MSRGASPAAWCATGRGPPVPHGGRKGYGRDRTPTLSGWEVGHR